MKRSGFEDVYFKITKLLNALKLSLTISYSRILALKYRRIIVKRKGISVIDKKTREAIKTYSKERFGKKAYWPYLALYSEIKGEFIKGWIPYDYFRYKLLSRINPQSCCAISEQKTFDYKIFGNFSIRPLFVYISGSYFTADLNKIEKEQACRLIADYNNYIVVKEENGTHGSKVKFIHSSEFSPDTFIENVNYIVQPQIKQYKPLADLYPDSVNTFRVTTYFDRNGSVTVKSVVLRFGVDKSRVDNISSGGQFIYFDLEGKPSKYGYDYLGFNVGEKHKNTGYVFTDIEVPMFGKIVESCRMAHMKYPYTRLIGWDVCINEAGEPKLIEWNSDNPSFWEFEATCGPYWKGDSEF